MPAAGGGMVAFVRDVRKMWTACWTYNPYGSALYRLAAILSHCAEAW
jgi:hypothetical protein